MLKVSHMLAGKNDCHLNLVHKVLYINCMQMFFLYNWIVRYIRQKKIKLRRELIKTILKASYLTNSGKNP